MAPFNLTVEDILISHQQFADFQAKLNHLLSGITNLQSGLAGRNQISAQIASHRARALDYIISLNQYSDEEIMAYAARCEKFHRNLMEVYDNYMVTHNPVLVPMLEPFTSTSFASAAQFEPMPSTSSSPTPSTSSGIQPLFNYVTSLRPTLEETAPIPSTSSGIPHFNDLVTILAPFFEENAPQPEPVASDSSVVQHISDFVTDFEPQLQATPSTSSGAQQNDLVTLLTSLYGGVVQSEPVSSTSSDHSSTPRTYEEAVKLIGLEDEEIPQAEQMEVEDVRAMPPPSPRPMWQPWIAEFEEVHAENVQQNVIPIAQGSNYLRHNIQHQVLPCSTRRSMMKPRRYTFKKDMPKSPPKIRVIKPKAVRQNQNNVNGNAVPAPMNIANNSPNSPLDLSSRAASMYRPSRSNMPLVNPRVGILNPIYQNAVVNPLAFRNNVASSSSNGQSQNSTPANNTARSNSDSQERCTPGRCNPERCSSESFCPARCSRDQRVPATIASMSLPRQPLERPFSMVGPTRQRFGRPDTTRPYPDDSPEAQRDFFRRLELQMRYDSTNMRPGRTPIFQAYDELFMIYTRPFHCHKCNADVYVRRSPFL